MNLPPWIDSVLLDAAGRYRRFADSIEIQKGQPFIGIREHNSEEAKLYYRAACSGSADEKWDAYQRLLNGPPMKHGGVRMIGWELFDTLGNICR